MAHLESISLEKFRVFDKEFSMDIAPVTFLTGPNSSGKSSIFKSILLLKSNHNSSLQVLDFSGKDHNLGTFEATLNNNSQKDEIIYFGLSSNISDTNYPLGSTFLKEPVTTKRSVYHVLYEVDSKDVEKVKIRLGYRKLDTSGKIQEIYIYKQDESTPFLQLNIAKDENSVHTLKFDFEQIRKSKILKNTFFQRIVDDKAKIEKIDKVKTYTLKSKFKILDESQIQFYDEPILVFAKLFEQFIKDNVKAKDISQLHDYFLKLPLARILKDFSSLLDNTIFMEAVRANTKRLYTNDSQGTSFNDLILDFKSRDISSQGVAFLNHWLKKFEIADRIEFENIEGVATSIYLYTGNNKVALADLGYGVTQFLPILLNIAMEQPIVTPKKNTRIKIVKKLILLEEPETNLHPKLQSLLADCLLDATKKFEVRFIVETHSEYLIRKMQILVAEKTILQQHVLIYYFINPNKVPKNEKQITKIEIKENGSLTDDFGAGFYDEATKMKFELLKLKQ